MNTSKGNSKTAWAAVILSAGRSSRMQQHKALLRFDVHKTFIRKIVDEYVQAGCREIVVVTNKDNNKSIKEACSKNQNARIKFVINDHLEKEKFYSVRLGIENCLTAGGCFVQPCDNPFVTVELIKKMLLLLEDESYVVPVYKGKKGHPVLLGRNLLRAVCQAEDDAMNFKDFLQKFDSRLFESTDSHVLDNINTFSEYKYFFDI